MSRWTRIACLLAVGLGALARADQLNEDVVAELRKLPGYVPEERHAGVIRSVGSSTISGVLGRLEQAFRTYQPDASVTIRAAGSGMAPPALIDGSADIAPMSRPMEQKERDAFVERFGYPPTEITIAFDAIAVLVNAHNSVEQLTLPQVDAIFSATRVRGGDPVLLWADVGGEGDVGRGTFRRFGLSEVNGIHPLFRDLALGGGAYRGDISVEPGSSSVANAVGAYRDAIGYASHCFGTRRTKPLALAAEATGPYVPLTYRTCVDGSYPLTRKLFLYVNRKPDQHLPPLVHHFLRFVLSSPGQRVVGESGHFPIPAAMVEEQREILFGG